MANNHTHQNIRKHIHTNLVLFNLEQFGAERLDRAHIGDGLIGSGARLAERRPDVLVDEAAPDRVLARDLHDRRDRAQREHGEAPRGEEAEEERAAKEQHVLQKAGEHRLDGREHAVDIVAARRRCAHGSSRQSGVTIRRRDKANLQFSCQTWVKQMANCPRIDGKIFLRVVKMHDD